MRQILVLMALVSIALVVQGADLSGTWSAEVVLDAGSGTATFVLKQSGDALSGTYNGALGDAKVTGTVKGNNVEWSFENPDAGKVVYKGTLSGANKITGTTEYGAVGKGTFTATKK